MNIMNRIDKFRKLKKKYGDNNLFSIFLFLYFFKKWNIGIQDYFENKVYCDCPEREARLESIFEYTHSWTIQKKIYQAEHSKIWFLYHYFEFQTMRLFYRGLDAADYFRYQFYAVRHCRRKTFITEGRLAELNQEFNKNGDISLENDKGKFNTLFSPFIYRKWFLSYNISRPDFLAMCDGLDRVIVKPLEGSQGKGIFVADVSASEDREKLFQQIKDDKYIVEELVHQHASVSAVNPACTNTIRVYSVVKDNAVYVTGAVFRIGNGLQPTDNYCAGGYAAEIDLQTGIVISTAINKEGDRVLIHPVTGHVILGFRLPCWDMVIDTVKKAHRLVPDLRYMAWDVVVTDDERVTFLEGNTWGGVELQQHPSQTGKLPIYESLL